MKTHPNKHAFACKDGPLEGRVLYLDPDGCTAYFEYKGQLGRYRNGYWESKRNAARAA